mgnify:CR=1 FL=1
MNFLKELLIIQHEIMTQKTASLLLQNDCEKELFIKKYNKKNYVMVKVSNCKLRNTRVKIDHILSNLQCDHNSS